MRTNFTQQNVGKDTRSGIITPKVKLISMLICSLGAVPEILPAATVLIPEAGLQLNSLLPADTQGQFGAYTQARLSNGTYANMSSNYNGNGDYYWFYGIGSPRIYPAPASQSTTSGPRVTPNALYAPPGSGIDSIFRVDAILPAAQTAIQITGSVLHFQVSGPSNVSDGVTAFIYTDVSGYGSPIWSHTFATNTGSPSEPINITVPYTGATSLYFAISDNGGFIADHTDWVNVRLSAVPEPSAACLAVGCLTALSLRRRRH